MSSYKYIYSAKYSRIKMRRKSYKILGKSVNKSVFAFICTLALIKRLIAEKG